MRKTYPRFNNPHTRSKKECLSGLKTEVTSWQ